MVGDRVRTGSYEQALARAVRPGSVVLDIGTGSGIMALYACRYGARKVYAIEPDEAIHVGRALAAANGLSDRIEFIQGLSTEVTLPEKADLIVSDLRGLIPVVYPHLNSILDARERHLAEGGVLIPRADTLWLAPVQAEREFSRIVTPWRAAAPELDMEVAVRAAVNDWGRLRQPYEEMIGEPQPWARLDYATVVDPSVRGTVEWRMEEPTRGHGVIGWFDAELTEGVGFSTDPRAEERIYGTAFFPWPEEISFEAGDRLIVRMHAKQIAEGYDWIWETRVERTDGTVFTHRQGTLGAQVQSLDRLRKLSHSYRAVAGESGRVDAAILTLMDGSASLGEIATEILRSFPGRFARWEDALSHVGAMSDRYSE
jgi:type I protein arginine methyltransferase